MTMKKRIFSVLLALCLFAALLPSTALAATVIDSGTCGTNVYWTLDNDGLLTISGTGKMEYVWDTTTPWPGMKTPIQKVVVEEGITDLGETMFYGLQRLTSVEIHARVTTIGRNMFSACFALQSATIPSSVMTIEDYAFSVDDFGKVLTDIYFEGTKSQWEDISVGVGNDILSFATIHYNSKGPGDEKALVGVIVSGAPIEWTDSVPYIDANSRTMVPLRAVANAMHLSVNWNSEAREAIFSDGNKTISFPIDSTTARTSDGKVITMDTAAVIVNSRTYAPIRYLAEYFGYTVSWDGANRSVILK